MSETGYPIMVVLNYFTETGKWKYETERVEIPVDHYWEVPDYLVTEIGRDRAPGLRSGSWNGYVLIRGVGPNEFFMLVDLTREKIRAGLLSLLGLHDPRDKRRSI